MKLNSKLFKDILTEVDKKGVRSYSQGRLYLLWSVLAYYITIGIITTKALRPNMELELDPLKTIIDALQWCLALFAGYAFGGKTLETAKSIFGKTETKPEAKPAEKPAEETKEPEI